jgi:hypothetical protein
MSALFEPEPQQWGLRGDPYLWRALRDHLSDTDVPTSTAEVSVILHATFADLSGVDLATHQVASVYLEQYAHGGMSSGVISVHTWRHRLMPMLTERADVLLKEGRQARP